MELWKTHSWTQTFAGNHDGLFSLIVWSRRVLMCLAQSWSSFREGSCQEGQTFTFHLSRKAQTNQSKPGNEQEPFLPPAQLRFGDLPWTIFRGDTKICLYMRFADARQVTVNEQCICSFSSHTRFSFTVCHPVSPLNTSSG